MKISYSDDTHKGPGHGLFTFREALFPDGPYSMAVLRASDQASLAAGPGGGAIWVGETRFIPVRTETTPDGALTVPVGPEVVDALDPLEQYLVTLKPEQGDPLKARLQVQGITYSPDSALDNTGMHVPEPAKPMMVAAPPEPAPADPAESAAPEVPPPDPEPAPPEVPAPEAPLPETELNGPSVPEAAPKRRRLGPVLIVALVAALLACGFATWKFFDSKAQEEKAALSRPAKPEKPAPPEPEAAPAPEAAKAAAPEPEAAPAPEAAKAAAPEPEQAAPSTELPPTPKTAEEQVRDFFSGPDITAAAALALAAELPKNTPGEQDALYRLYYFAAGQEAPGAFMPYATCLDPAEPRWGSIEKDAAAAYAAYAKAAASDPKVAKAALDAQTRLRAWLEREAASGNAQARAWLQELP